MINISFEEKGNEFKLYVNGHAGYAAHGKDIVCAAVSALVYTLINHLDKVTSAYDVIIDDQDVYIKGYGTGAMAAYRTIMTGCEMITDMYPDNVCMSPGVPYDVTKKCDKDNIYDS